MVPSVNCATETHCLRVTMISEGDKSVILVSILIGIKYLMVYICFIFHMNRLPAIQSRQTIHSTLDWLQYETLLCFELKQMKIKLYELS